MTSPVLEKLQTELPTRLRRGGVKVTIPPAPTRVSEVGVSVAFLRDLVSKFLFRRGALSVLGLSQLMALPRSVVAELFPYLRDERIVEVARGGDPEVDAEYQLTANGRDRAAAALQRSEYVGPTPVPLELYQAIVGAQSIHNERFEAAAVRSAFADVVLSPKLVDQVGSAMNSGRAMMLYGPPGSGKTYIAELLARLAGGTVTVPHAVYVGDEVIQVYDPIVHQSVKDFTVARGSIDARWVPCRRPVVLSGGELTLEMLELQYDESSRFYQAPPHMKANGGVYVVDDLGRQRCAPRDLMNRWIVPLDRRRDYMALRNGQKFAVPFEMAVVFSTNLRPHELADEAFLRRFGYKIAVGPVSVTDYRRIFEGVCRELEVRFDAAAFVWLLTERHRTLGRPLLACYPRDLVSKVLDSALYKGTDAELTREALEDAWEAYFVPETDTAGISDDFNDPLIV